MIYEYSAECHTQELMTHVDERWLFRVPVRMVEQNDLVSLTPFGRQRRVWFPRLFVLRHNGPSYDTVYVDAWHSRGARREEVPEHCASV